MKKSYKKHNFFKIQKKIYFILIILIQNEIGILQKICQIKEMQEKINFSFDSFLFV